jgi:hypothetical protein
MQDVHLQNANAWANLTEATPAEPAATGAAPWGEAAPVDEDNLWTEFQGREAQQKQQEQEVKRIQEEERRAKEEAAAAAARKAEEVCFRMCDLGWGLSGPSVRERRQAGVHGGGKIYACMHLAAFNPPTHAHSVLPQEAAALKRAEEEKAEAERRAAEEQRERERAQFEASWSMNILVIVSASFPGKGCAWA